MAVYTYRMILTWSEPNNEWIAVAQQDGRSIPQPQHNDVPASAS